MLRVGVSFLFAHLALGESAPDAIVVDGPWRLTAVTDQLIRVEYDEEQHFVDEPTAAFVRSKPTGIWTSNHSITSGVWRTLKTRKVLVRFRRNLPPSAGTVEIAELTDTHVWRWGDDPAVGNLGGTARTLDSNAESLDLNCHHKVSPTMDNSEMHCAWGLVSQTGWAIINETGSPVIRDGWFAPSRNSTDVFVFMHGLDFSSAMKDYAYAAGPPAVPPRYAFGTIFTRWFNFDSDSVMDLVDDFESRSMPLDAWIFDMNWHIYGPWGSFSWNDVSYPKLQELLNWFQSRKLPIGANTHDHDGIAPSERTYDKFCAALNRTPCNGTIPFDLYNKTYAFAQEDIAWRAIETKGKTQGIDFAWIDYQQGEANTFQKTTIPNLNPTMVLNWLRSTDPQRQGENKRSLILSRWGGYGSHRYPLGFSGDQYHSWNGLAFLPYFTSTAANVAFGYWSHDTVGADHEHATDYELSVRWVQVSAWSPVLRFHDKGAGTGDCATKNECARIVPWDVPNQFFKAIREAAKQRDQLIPYMYTAAFAAVGTGLTLVRPMYYHDPSDSALYDLHKQYLFGPDMVISPITSPSGPNESGLEQALGANTWSVYAPSSTSGWVDRLNGDFYSEGTASSVYGIMDVPGLIRQGAVIPMRPHLRGESSLARARQSLHSVEFRIAPAKAFYHGKAMSGSGQVIDDDGVSMDYAQGNYTSTICNYTFVGRTFKISVAQSGDFAGRPTNVLVSLSLPQLPPVKVTSLGGFSGAVSNTYDHNLIGSVITLRNVDLRKGISIELEIISDYPLSALPNLIGLLGRVRRARYVKGALDAANINYGDTRANITSIVLSATRMSPTYVESLPTLWDGAVQQADTLVHQDHTLKQDERRRTFVSKMMMLDTARTKVGTFASMFI